MVFIQFLAGAATQLTCRKRQKYLFFSRHFIFYLKSFGFSFLSVFEEELGEADEAEMLFMDEFEETQLLNTRLQVKCTSSKYTHSASFQFALELETQNETRVVYVSGSVCCELIYKYGGENA
jgi:hypothetical protein